MTILKMEQKEGEIIPCEALFSDFSEPMHIFFYTLILSLKMERICRFIKFFIDYPEMPHCLYFKIEAILV